MVEESHQKIRQVSLKNEDLILSPEFIREIFTTNKFQRSISLLEGFTGDRTKLLRCMPSGILKTAPIATGLEEYLKKTGICVTIWHDDDTFIFDSPFSRWDIFIENYDVVIGFRNKPNTFWGDDIILNVGWHSIDLVSYGIRLHNRADGDLSTYQIVAYR